MKRRQFIIVLAAIMFILIAANVGGTVAVALRKGWAGLGWKGNLEGIPEQGRERGRGFIVLVSKGKRKCWYRQKLATTVVVV
jgi:hypothetical protein